MTNVLLAYIAVVLTAYSTLECVRANRYRRENTEIHEDEVEARLIALARELGQQPDRIVARAGAQQRDQRGDGGDTSVESDLAHALKVAARSEVVR